MRLPKPSKVTPFSVSTAAEEAMAPTAIIHRTSTAKRICAVCAQEPRRGGPATVRTQNGAPEEAQGTTGHIFPRPALAVSRPLGERSNLRRKIENRAPGRTSVLWWGVGFGTCGLRKHFGFQVSSCEMWRRAAQQPLALLPTAGAARLLAPRVRSGESHVLSPIDAELTAP
jgi:hypothetical protein